MPQTADEILVVGTKRRESLADVPFAMSVVNVGGTRLADRAATTDDVVFAAGDVQLTNLGPGRNRLFIRGVADSAFSGPTQSTVSIYLDDARINFNAPDPDLRLVDVDRVEVLKGPQGSLYGTGALGGIYRIVPNKAVFGETSGRVAAGLSAVAHGALGGSIEGTLNLPLLDDSAALRLTGYVIRDGGWVDDSGRGAMDVNRVTTKGVRGSFRAALDDDWTIEAAGVAQFIGARDSQYSFVGAPPRSRSTAFAEPSDNDFLHGRLALSGHLGRFDLNSTTAIVSHRVENLYDASSAAALFGRAAPLRYDDLQTLTLATHETRLSDASLERPWVIGISLLSAASKLRGDLLDPVLAPATVIRLRHDVQEGALFGEGTVSLPANFEATGGLRLSLTASHDESSQSREDRATKIAVTPMLALRWRPTPTFQLYGRFASALRAGGLNPSGAPVSFKSDKLESFELGGRLSSDDSRLLLSVDLFRVRWHDIQSDLLEANGLVTTANVGTGRNLGADVSLIARPMPGWRLEAGAVVQEAELRRTVAVTAGQREPGLPSVPDRTFRLGLTREIAIGDNRFSVDITARYVGKSRLSFDSSLDRRMGGYTTADAQATYATGAWRWSATVTNLLGDDGDTFSFGNPFSIRSQDQHVTVRPRSVELRVERTF